MQEIIAPVVHIKFDIEVAIETQVGALPLPFPGMDKSGAAICNFYLLDVCQKGTACPFRHVKGDRTVVCKHWLRGLCKKGDDCEFLHEYDMSKMPECYFFSKFKQCSNKECPFLHIDPEKKIKDCPWYDRGFCRHGLHCKNRHVRRVICQCYVNGFCPKGPDCKHVHAKFELPVIDPSAQAKKASIVCHFCGEFGHKAINCNKMPPEAKGGLEQERPIGSLHGHQYHHQHRDQGRNPDNPEERRDFSKITCFKCGEKGHYANKCSKAYLAFLSNPNNKPEQSV